MTKINPRFAPVTELSSDRRMQELEPLTGLERLAEMLGVTPGDLTHPSTPEEILAAFEHRRAL